MGRIAIVLCLAACGWLGCGDDSASARDAGPTDAGKPVEAGATDASQQADAGDGAAGSDVDAGAADDGGGVGTNVGCPFDAARATTACVSSNVCNVSYTTTLDDATTMSCNHIKGKLFKGQPCPKDLAPMGTLGGCCFYPDGLHAGLASFGEHASCYYGVDAQMIAFLKRDCNQPQYAGCWSSSAR